MLADLTTITKAVRTEVRASVKAGTITVPEGAKVSVRCKHGDTVEITVTDAPDGWALAPNEYGNEVTSPAARALGDRLVEVLRKHVDWQWGRVLTSQGYCIGLLPRPDYK